MDEKTNKIKILAIIPARGGSKGIPRKNIKFLGGKPLIAYTIEAATSSKYIDRTIVSTDDEEIAKTSRGFGAEVIKRPKNLARDKTPTEPVIEHVLKVLKQKNYSPDIIVLLQPTSPLRNKMDIDDAYVQFIRGKYDSLFSCILFPYFIWRRCKDGSIKPLNYDYRHRKRHQELYDLKENGSIYIFKREMFRKNKNRLGGKIGYYLMTEEYSEQIDSGWQFSLLENIMKMLIKRGDRIIR